MIKTFSILSAVALGAAFVATAATAQNSNVCGPEVYSLAVQNYVSLPCNSENRQAPTPTSGPACGPEAYSLALQNYTSLPCPAGTTYENPGWKGPKPQ
jgi:hypothetical protein